MLLRTNRTRYDMSKWSNILDGLPVFILGNGPSILKQTLSLLDGYFTIGINRIFDLYQPTMLFWQDIELIKDYKKKVENCPAIKVCRDTADPDKKFSNYSLGLNPYRVHYAPQRLWGRGCSGALAAELAISMGAGSIILLGCDCIPRDGNSKMTDFYGKNRHHKRHTMANFARAMEWLKDESPIPVYSTEGSIHFFETLPLEKIIEILDPPKMSRCEYMSLLVN